MPCRNLGDGVWICSKPALGDLVMREKDVIEELRNIRDNGPVWAGDTISHRTANECVRRGWARRDGRGHFVITDRAPRNLEPLSY